MQFVWYIKEPPKQERSKDSFCVFTLMKSNGAQEKTASCLIFFPHNKTRQKQTNWVELLNQKKPDI